MNILLDTCALLWLASDQKQLSGRARHLIGVHAETLYVSAISAFEIGIKHHKGKLNLGMAPDVWWPRVLAQHGLFSIDISDSIALASTALPTIHPDPCDRIIIATSVALDAVILTSDQLFASYPGVKVEW